MKNKFVLTAALVAAAGLIPAISSASTREQQQQSQPIHQHTEVMYKHTPNPGGIAAADRNLRFGLVGNGTGIGTDDTTSKFLTDNDTVSDPSIMHNFGLHSGALSGPTADQDPLKDIKSGTTYQYYDIEK